MSSEWNLQSGERLLWSGRSERRLPVSRQDVRPVPMIVSAIALTLLIVAAANRQLVGVLFCGAVAFMTLRESIGSMIWRWRHLRSTRYAITDRRVIVVRTSPAMRAEAYLRDLPPPVTTEDGPVGTVAFGAIAGDLSAGGPVLYAIGEPRRVRDLIASAQTSARQA